MTAKFPSPKWRSRNEQMAALTGAKPAVYPSISRLKAREKDEDPEQPTTSQIAHSIEEFERQVREWKA